MAHQNSVRESLCCVLHHTHSQRFNYKDTTTPLFHYHPALNILLFLLYFFIFLHTHNHVFSGPQPTSSYFFSCLLLFTHFCCAWSFWFRVLFFLFHFLILCLIWFFVVGVCVELDEFWVEILVFFGTFFLVYDDY